MKSQLTVPSLALVLFVGACSLKSDSPAASDPNSTVGMLGGSGAGPTASANDSSGSCSDVSACGGNLVGTWSVAASCLNVNGDLQVGGFGLGCASVTVTGSLQVSGTWTANADGTYADNTMTSGTEQITVAAACLNVSGTTTTCDRIGGPLQGIGYASVNCTAASSGGCTCEATVQQTGGLGLASSDPQTSGNYSTSGNVVSIDDAQQSYCVAGNQMTWTPQSTSPFTKGSITFQKGNGAVAVASGSETGANVGGKVAPPGTMGGAGQASGAADASGSAGVPEPTGPVMGPCDIYAAGNTPCVAAFSTVRQLSSAYAGPLYQVRKGGMRTG
ncbi:MAG TPA: arabinofuranosidase catalytic domain-containing protein, partial [Polyangiaceae bacterium]|nr:arabinofuranosidase catalytic domain-containing protein [Polyangiaceae bacterium]